MPVLSDFTMGEIDGSYAITMTPAVNISGWNIQFKMMNRFGGSGIILKSAASGFNNVSGINVTDGVVGKFTITLGQLEVSGYDYKNYAYRIDRLDSGFVTSINEGYRIFIP